MRNLTTNQNQLVVQNSEAAIDQLKLEIATELGIEISPEMTTRDAGRIGGAVTRKLIELGEQKLAEMSINNQVNSQYNNVHQDKLH